MDWTTRPKPFPDHSCLPEYHYLPYNNTPREGRNPDDWQPRVQLKKERGSGRLVLSDSESVAAFSDKFIVKPKFVVEHLKHLEVVDFKKKKRAEERAKESQKAKEKNHEDYAWKDLCEDPTKLQKLRVAELNKYLKHRRLDKHLKSTKHDKVKVIARHWLLQMNPERTDLLQTRLREKDSAENESLLDIDTTMIAMNTSTVEAKAAVKETNRMMSFLPSSMTMKKLPSSMTKKLRGQPQQVREEP